MHNAVEVNDYNNDKTKEVKRPLVESRKVSSQEVIRNRSKKSYSNIMNTESNDGNDVNAKAHVNTKLGLRLL